jgi:hypothetical protein
MDQYLSDLLFIEEQEAHQEEQRKKLEQKKREADFPKARIFKRRKR